MNPRVSFSQDFSQTDLRPVEVEGHPLRSNSAGLNLGFDFDFCVHESSELESSSADELFSDGVMLPTEIKKKNSSNAPKKALPHHHHHSLPPPPPPPPPYAVCENASTSKISKKVSIKDLNYEVDDGKHSHSSNSKSFWSFKRSTSCGSGYGRTLCPLPPLLNRSSSTGSSTNVKKEGPPHVNQNSQKQRHSTTTTTRSSSQTLCPNNRQKPPLKRSHTHTHGAYANITPVLNVPSANLFGLASIFSNYRDKSKKK